MRLLCLETATAAGAVALLDGGVVLAEVVTTTQRAHTETLLPAAATMLEEAGLRVGDLDGVVVDVGPGLFTGLRVGVATARSLALAAGIPLFEVTSLEVLACDPATPASGVILALVDARRGEVFAQCFAAQGDERRALGAPAVLRPEELSAWISAAVVPGAIISVVGDGAARYPEVAATVGKVLDEVVVPSPAAAGRLVLRRGDAPGPAASVVPLYLRDPDAIANFKVAPAGRTP